MKRLLCVSMFSAIAMLPLSGTSVFAVDHLVSSHQEHDFISEDYERILRTVFKDVFARDIVARVVVQNPTGLESAAAIRRDGKGAEIISITAPERLLSYAELDEERHQMMRNEEIESLIAYLEPKHLRAEDVVAETCRAPIETELADKIIDVWSYMLARTGEEEQPSSSTQDVKRVSTVTVDGALYEFSHRNGERGDVYGPNATGDATALLGIVDRLNAACEKPGQDARMLLLKDVDDFIERNRVGPVE